MIYSKEVLTEEQIKKLYEETRPKYCVWKKIKGEWRFFCEGRIY